MIVGNEPFYDLMIVPSKLKLVDTIEFCEILKIDKQTLLDKIKKAKNYSRIKPSVFLAQISKNDYAVIQEKLWKYNGFSVRKKSNRNYLLNSASNILGYISEVNDYEINDNSYLEHMIPHHQVAVDISILLQKKTKNPEMQDILRKLIWVQNYEIQLMRDMAKGLPENDMSTSEIDMVRNYTITIGDLTKPNKVGLTKTYCDPHFFDPKKHMEHMKHMKLDDKMYIKHMIPHHQVAIDMSKRLLLHTNNSYLIDFCRKLIIDQQGEIFYMNNLLNNSYNYQSELLQNLSILKNYILQKI